jgi:hypothetical protein
LESAVSTLARYHFDPRLRHKLLWCRNEMEQGESAWPTLRRAGLLHKPEADALVKSGSPAIESWLATQLATSRERTSEQRRAYRLLGLHPLVVALLGLGVFWLGDFVIGTLRSLIMSQS